jgi:predicted dehydrogenase
MLKALVLGCGNIAGGYDEFTSKEHSLTHAGAYARNPAFELSACIEPNKTRREAFMNYWEIPQGFNDLAACRKATGLKFDVASVCTPTPSHATILEDLLDSPIQFVLSEKPMTENIADARLLVHAYENAGKILAINYMRSWDPVFDALRSDIYSGKLGDVQSIVVQYGKGLLNNGSHILNLIQFLIGSIQAERVNNIINDGRNIDPTLDATLKTENGRPIYFCGSDFRHYQLFEMDINLTKGRVNISDGGNYLTVQQIMESEMFPGYRVLGSGKKQTTSLSNNMDFVMQAIEASSNGKKDIYHCTGRLALTTQELCATLFDLAKTKERA